ncbi:MAG TPA: class I SAM-dependent methyltransferase [Thermoprotei archaeon]|nr:class I SAM-dependent methyltransferase [Thermoprotei archaeon]
MKDRYVSPLLLSNPLRAVITPKGKTLSRFRYLIEKGDHVIDLGAGPGYFTNELASLVGNGGAVYAVEPNPDAAKRLRLKASSNVRVYETSADDLGFLASETIDFAFSNLTLCCMANPVKGVNEMLRVLKTGAHAYVSVTGRFTSTMGKAEWARFLGNVRVISSGKGVMEEWAVIQKVRSPFFIHGRVAHHPWASGFRVHVDENCPTPQGKRAVRGQRSTFVNCGHAPNAVTEGMNLSWKPCHPLELGNLSCPALL